MRSQEILPRIGELAKPYIEAAVGPLPEIQFRTIKSTAWLRDMFVFPDKEAKSWCVWFDPESVDELIDDGRYGEVFHCIIHELMHLVNCEAKRVVLNRAWENFKLPKCAADLDPRDPWNRYSHWSEGGAELSAVSVSLKIMNLGLSDDLLFELFGVRTQGQLEFQVGWTLAQFAIALYRSKRVSQIDLAALDLPFDVEAIKGIAGGVMQGAGIRRQYSHILFMPYALGVSRCAKYMRASSMSLAGLLTAPVTDRQLRQAIA